MRKLCLIGLALCVLAVFAFSGCDGPSGSMKSDGPAAPTERLTGVSPTTVGGNDGKVTGTDPGMEYSLDVGKTWSSCTGTEITGLSPCTVLVRYAETESAEAGDAVTVTVYDKNVTFKVKYEENGATSGAAPEDSTEYVPTGAVTVLGNTGSLAKTDCIFGGWNTKADGTGSAYKAGEVFGITENTTLYAQWKEKTKYSLSGEFTIGKNGYKVYFSQGNMYWNGSAFKFEDNQYSYANSWNTNHVSHLYWTKLESRSYTQNYNDTGYKANNILFTNDTATIAKSSFTVNEVTGKYRTLSRSEWEYLFNRRTDAAKKAGYATVWGVNGIIILPDSFEDPKTNTSEKATENAFIPKSTTGYGANVYTGDNWTAMEDAGAVFLPVAGGRRGNSMMVQTWGIYWASMGANDTSAYQIVFDDGSKFGTYYDNFNYCSAAVTIRLVCDAE